MSLLTGDFSVDGNEADLSGLGVSRTHTTLAPPNESATAEGVFGPGWTASLPSEGASGYTFEDHSSDGYLLLLGPDGETLTYEAGSDKVAFTGISDADDGSVITKDSADKYTLTDTDGAKTVFTKANTFWNVTRIDRPGAEGTTVYTRDPTGRVTRVLAPVATGVSCTAGLVAGCRALDLTYASATTATGTAESAWGDRAGRLAKVAFTAYDPATSAMKTAVVAQYAYDSTGHLRAAWDPRTSPVLKTRYSYDPAGRIATLTPPGLATWSMTYDAKGRLAAVSRPDPAIGTVTWPIAYDIPITGSGAPVDLSGAQTTRWAQSVDLPRIGAALFPASRVPPRGTDGAYAPGSADWPYAEVTYLDVNGRAVNTAVWGAGAWQISATRYDTRGNAVWDLSAGNRAEALQPAGTTDPYVAGLADSAGRADLLAQVNTYNDDGDILTGTGPAHPVTLASGKEVSARTVTTSAYDEGKPDSASYHLPTTTTEAPLVLDGTATPAAADTKTTRIGYAALVPGDTNGWTLRLPTTGVAVVGSGQSDLVTRTRYDGAGRLTEYREPGSGGADPSTTVTTYYTAAANPAYPECGARPQWTGLVCRTGPKVQPPARPFRPR